MLENPFEREISGNCGRRAGHDAGGQPAHQVGRDRQAQFIHEASVDHLPVEVRATSSSTTSAAALVECVDDVGGCRPLRRQMAPFSSIPDPLDGGRRDSPPVMMSAFGVSSWRSARRGRSDGSSTDSVTTARRGAAALPAATRLGAVALGVGSRYRSARTVPAAATIQSQLARMARNTRASPSPPRPPLTPSIEIAPSALATMFAITHGRLSGRCRSSRRYRPSGSTSSCGVGSS